MKKRMGILVTSMFLILPTIASAEKEKDWHLVEPSSPGIEAKWLEELGPEFQQEYNTYNIQQKKEILSEFYNASKKTEEFKKQLANNENSKYLTQQASSRWTGSGMGTMGDALVSLDNGSSSFRWGHAGIVADNNAYVFEANPGEGVQRKANYWNTYYNSKYALYVKGATTNAYQGAQHYGWQQWRNGKPYGLSMNKWDESSYYCSKLVWRAWKNEGVDLDADGGPTVWPVDILNSSQTVSY
ncbi:YiiX/YebB-like N1pC/P60 family cysteine hydrolase [Bacillus mycoides]|uniref:YiiX/YebB-like N1pC/P60 family cysteine hydrolase n=1 Tax=Bacillus mycoides TaxID=1405 RepID=UPI0024ADFF6A|nr:YiiX/YebB-like N1pC/P60 family cysteine hydrolase [Bacillus mycoides]MDI6534746.1 YiiX/YebB-like N1pC/P60 family cysteine hydrolase [Bacillus mycoides]WJE61767.1 YiiX/YebB-like N1pC/P60 family cysteine hydrolase [Bacillus mycoides]